MPWSSQETVFVLILMQDEVEDEDEQIIQSTE